MSIGTRARQAHSVENGADETFAVTAAIDAWLDGRSRRAEPDWRGVLSAISARLSEILETPVIGDDPRVRAIVNDMRFAGGMPALSAEIDRLDRRIAELLSLQPSAPFGPARPDAAPRHAAGRIKLHL